jgi:hypothetical protein
MDVPKYMDARGRGFQCRRIPGMEEVVGHRRNHNQDNRHSNLHRRNRKNRVRSVPQPSILSLEFALYPCEYSRHVRTFRFPHLPL